LKLLICLGAALFIINPIIVLAELPSAYIAHMNEAERASPRVTKPILIFDSSVQVKEPSALSEAIDQLAIERWDLWMDEGRSVRRNQGGRRVWNVGRWWHAIFERTGFDNPICTSHVYVSRSGCSEIHYLDMLFYGFAAFSQGGSGRNLRKDQGAIRCDNRGSCQFVSGLHFGELVVYENRPNPRADSDHSLQNKGSNRESTRVDRATALFPLLFFVLSCMGVCRYVAAMLRRRYVIAALSIAISASAIVYVSRFLLLGQWS